MIIDALILAAGSSSRMGTSKQLLPIGNMPLLRYTTMQAMESKVRSTTVVLGHAYELHHQAIMHLPVSIVTHTDWKKGMGSSMKAGLQKILTQTPSLDAVVIMVCDQPYLTTKLLNRLLDNFVASRKCIVASYYASVAGVPAVFDKKYFPDLLKVDDFAGARKLIKEFFADVRTVDFPEGSIDLDTPEDYQHFIKKIKPSTFQ